MQLTEQKKLFREKEATAVVPGSSLSVTTWDSLGAIPNAEGPGFEASSNFSSDLHKKFKFFLYCYDLI